MSGPKIKAKVTEWYRAAPAAQRAQESRLISAVSRTQGQSQDFVERTIIGLLSGFAVPTNGTLIGVLSQLVGSDELWRLQRLLPLSGKPPESVKPIIERVYDRLAHSLIDAMMQALPGRSRETMVWGYEYALGALLMHVADRRVERLSEGRAQSGDPRMCDFFVHMIAALFRALPVASDEAALREGEAPSGLRA